MTERPNRIVISFIVLVSVLASSMSLVLPASAAQDGGSGKTVNLQIIVDSSGSMAAPTDTGVVRMDAAKTVLNEVISQIPAAENINVGLRVYGHRGDNTDAGRPESCFSSDLVVPMSDVVSVALTAQVNSLQPVGWTPIGYSLQQAANDFSQPTSDNAVNAIVMVTDGLETCDADPVAIAGELRNSEKGITTHVIGFGTTPDEQAILSGIAEAGGGQLFGSNNAGQLMSALFVVLEELEVVEETGTGESRSSPLGIGRVGRVGDYEISVLSVAPDASQLVAMDNSVYTPPPAGFQFFGARVSVTYVGPTSGTANDLFFFSVGSSSKGYQHNKDICSTTMFYPDNVFDAGELFPGGTGEYLVCWQIEAADADSLVMYVELKPYAETPGQEPQRVWFSLGNPIEDPVGTETETRVAADPPQLEEAGGTSQPSTDAPQASDQETEASTQDTSPQISIDDGGIEPDQVTAPANTQITLTISIDGTRNCSFVLQDIFPIETGALPPGSVTTIETTLAPGRYPLYCSGPDDTGAGETGILIVE